MKLVSWNVNGIRAALRNGFRAYVDAEQPDLLCIQESKAQPEQVELELPGYNAFWNSAERKGYSGTVAWTRQPPLTVSYGLGDLLVDTEGRVITLEFADFFVVTVYTPNSGRELLRLEYRTGEWDVAFRQYLLMLQARKPVIFCGDLNVAHQEIDLVRPGANHHSAGFTDQERASFSNLLAAGFIDSFRELDPRPGQYSWWPYWRDARERNLGWRIDYVCLSTPLRPRLRQAFIRSEVMGSDHCPVGIILD